MPLSLKSLLHTLGATLAVIGIIFISIRLYSYWSELDFYRITLLDWLLIVALAIIYCIINVFLAFSWWHILCHLRGGGNRILSVKIYGMSQLAKYVPGNIFHLAGRQVLGMASGIKASTLAKSTVLELIFIAGAGAIFGFLVLPILFLNFSEVDGIFIFFTLFILVLIALWQSQGKHLVYSFCYHVSFLTVSGAVFFALLSMNDMNEQSISFHQAPIIIGAYVISWLGGLVTPGSPAGVGVRELILLFLLKNYIIETDLLMAIILARLVTVIGDLFFFVVTLLIPNKSGRSEI
ncbi:hypothetical protein SBX64_03220 [Vibrio rhizosphaerae]|uniref:Flippase-like domain-containing protein n=1 Tax=Vibrio rhizosphaerae TaxID=398736 RepID=A0ABU4IQ92_9VIBR|nr:hypothetical protein [Vibrio rhizosphaerae]MDW6091567.1 hypothetical protein [Vibrio rhizosphaerae]